LSRGCGKVSRQDTWHARRADFPAPRATRQIRTAAQHLGGRRPGRPFAFHRNPPCAAPFESGAADSIFDRLIPRKDVIKTAFLRRNDNRAGRITAIIGDEFARRGDGARTAFHANQGLAKNLLVFISPQGRAGRREQKRCRAGDGQKVMVHSVFPRCEKMCVKRIRGGCYFPSMFLVREAACNRPRHGGTGFEGGVAKWQQWRRADSDRLADKNCGERLKPHMHFFDRRGRGGFFDHLVHRPVRGASRRGPLAA
jgi:hypothetical protein